MMSREEFVGILQDAEYDVFTMNGQIAIRVKNSDILSLGTSLALVAAHNAEENGDRVTKRTFEAILASLQTVLSHGQILRVGSQETLIGFWCYRAN